MSSMNGNGRRAHGTGSLYVRADGSGRESWYGQWRAQGVRHKRCIGPEARAWVARRPDTHPGRGEAPPA